MAVAKKGESRVWFITGGSSGLGYEFTKAALEAGDNVITVARNIEKLDRLQVQYKERLLSLSLDVTDRNAVFETVAAAHAHFGRLDIIVNNAGNMLMGMIEELSEEDARSQMETNFFAPYGLVRQLCLTCVYSNQGIFYKYQA